MKLTLDLFSVNIESPKPLLCGSSRNTIHTNSSTFPINVDFELLNENGTTLINGSAVLNSTNSGSTQTFTSGTFVVGLHDNIGSFPNQLILETTDFSFSKKKLKVTISVQDLLPLELELEVYGYDLKFDVNLIPDSVVVPSGTNPSYDVQIAAYSSIFAYRNLYGDAVIFVKTDSSIDNDPNLGVDIVSYSLTDSSNTELSTQRNGKICRKETIKIKQKYCVYANNADDYCVNEGSNECSYVDERTVGNQATELPVVVSGIVTDNTKITNGNCMQLDSVVFGTSDPVIDAAGYNAVPLLRTQKSVFEVTYTNLTSTSGFAYPSLLSSDVIMLVDKLALDNYVANPLISGGIVPNDSIALMFDGDDVSFSVTPYNFQPGDTQTLVGHNKAKFIIDPCANTITIEIYNDSTLLHTFVKNGVTNDYYVYGYIRDSQSVNKTTSKICFEDVLQSDKVVSVTTIELCNPSSGCSYDDEVNLPLLNNLNSYPIWDNNTSQVIYLGNITYPGSTASLKYPVPQDGGAAGMYYYLSKDKKYIINISYSNLVTSSDSYDLIWLISKTYIDGYVADPQNYSTPPNYLQSIGIDTTSTIVHTDNQNFPVEYTQSTDSVIIELSPCTELITYKFYKNGVLVKTINVSFDFNEDLALVTILTEDLPNNRPNAEFIVNSIIEADVILSSNSIPESSPSSSGNGCGCGGSSTSTISEIQLVECCTSSEIEIVSKSPLPLITIDYECTNCSQSNSCIIINRDNNLTITADFTNVRFEDVNGVPTLVSNDDIKITIKLISPLGEVYQLGIHELALVDINGGQTIFTILETMNLTNIKGDWILEVTTESTWHKCIKRFLIKGCDIFEVTQIDCQNYLFSNLSSEEIVVYVGKICSVTKFNVIDKIIIPPFSSVEYKFEIDAIYLIYVEGKGQYLLPVFTKFLTCVQNIIKNNLLELCSNCPDDDDCGCGKDCHCDDCQDASKQPSIDKILIIYHLYLALVNKYVNFTSFIYDDMQVNVIAEDVDSDLETIDLVGEFGVQSFPFDETLDSNVTPTIEYNGSIEPKTPFTKELLNDLLEICCLIDQVNKYCKECNLTIKDKDGCC